MAKSPWGHLIPLRNFLGGIFYLLIVICSIILISYFCKKMVSEMKKITTVFFSALLLIISSEINPQSKFDINTYKQFLVNNQNMETNQLLKMHPAGTFVSDINLSLTNVRYLDSISAKYELTDFEKALLQKNGFVVSERMKKISFGEAFLEIFQRDMPVFVSTDAILHAFHISYDRILRDVELGILIEKVRLLLQTLHSNQNILSSKYGSNPAMQKMLKDVDVYLTVPLKLFEVNINPFYSENAGFIDSILYKIENLQPDRTALFSDVSKIIDWSQFKPRGHYFEDQYTYPKTDLPKYFKAMIWLGRIELYLTSPTGTYKDDVPLKDLARQLIDSYLIKELIDETNSYSTYHEIESTIKIFAGDQDNVTIDHLTYLKNALNFNNADEFLNRDKALEFQDTLKNQSFANQRILSQILISDPLDPDSIVPASAFLLFGQRFVIDSYVTGSVVYDRIKYHGVKICRLLPSLLDVLFALGNSASAQLLDEELNLYHYSTNLAALRYLIDSYDNDFWSANFYSNWLNMIRQLNPPEDRSNLPGFMQSAAFWQEKMNTQLASWAELRHDNLLYAKQSYTGGTTCSYPYSYVEPFPEFYKSLREFAITAKNKIQTMSFSIPWIKDGINYYFTELQNISDTLMIISSKELNQEILSSAEITFLKNMIYWDASGGSGSTPYRGWYPRLFYNDTGLLGNFGTNPGLMDSDQLIADMHTVPTDCFGGPLGWVLHTGTGPINLGVFVTPWNDGVQTAFIGPVMSYYEYTTEKFLRLTDQEWNNQYLQSALRPNWVNIYLADINGNSRGSGPTLITSVDGNTNNTIIPQSEIIIANYPNPFNPSTLIVFTIPYDLANENTELKIFDVQGRLITTLVNEQLAAGKYVIKWEGKNQYNQNVSSGVYFYNIKAGNKVKSGKMNLLK